MFGCQVDCPSHKALKLLCVSIDLHNVTVTYNKFFFHKGIAALSLNVSVMTLLLFGDTDNHSAI